MGRWGTCSCVVSFGSWIQCELLELISGQDVGAPQHGQGSVGHGGTSVVSGGLHGSRDIIPSSK